MRNIAQILVGLRNGTITSKELVSESLSLIEQKDGGPNGLHAVLAISKDSIRRAEASDARRSRGEELSDWDGVPVLVKDCIETSDMPTTFGAKVFKGWRPQNDAQIVRCLRDQGVIIVGKASLDDFAAACYGISSLGGVIRNPRDTSRTVGGSSGGSAASVAAGYVPLAIGTDTGGSLRIPAALCGVVTLRPTIGSISLRGCFPRSPRQDVIGPIAHDVHDVIESFSMMTKDSTLLPRVEDRLSEYEESGIRFGFIETGLAIFGDEPEGMAVRALRNAISALRARGFAMEKVEAPQSDLLGAGSTITVDSESAVDRFLSERPTAPVHSLHELSLHKDIAHQANLTFSREVGVNPTSETLAQVERGRVLLREWWTEVSKKVNVLLYPAVQTTAVRVGQEQSGVFTRLSEHTGSPAVCVPYWLPGMKLPVSIEVMGKPSDDVGVLAAARLLEKVMAPFPVEENSGK